ncbi:MAG: peptidoglycan-binding protein [Phycisphaerales bacterium]|nr:peptidoglycan-binding protein [Phycisphaerales bacterium]
MPKFHTAVGSDHVASISLSQPAFISPEKLWAINEGRLRASHERADPNCLFKGDRAVPTGDKIELPGTLAKVAAGILNTFNKFQIGTKDLWIRVRVFREDFTPIKDAPYELTIPGSVPPTPFKGKTGPKGEIEQKVTGYFARRDPNYGAQATLVVRIKAADSDPKPAAAAPGPAPAPAPSPTPVRGDVPITWTLLVGRLNPICEKAPDVHCISGVQQRLNNLNMNTGPVDGLLGPNTQAAIKAFKDLYQLGPATSRDGKPDRAVFQAKLAEVHDGASPPPPPSPNP